MDDSPKKSPPTNNKLPRRVRLLKTLWKSLGPEQSANEKSDTDNVCYIFYFLYLPLLSFCAKSAKKARKKKKENRIIITSIHWGNL